MSESRDSDGTAMDAVMPPRWPPPGLERIQGDFLRVAARGALAGLLLVLPFLFVVTRDAGVATLGPLADAWWVIIALGTIGLAFGLDAIARTARVLRRSGEALRRGYDLATILHVLADAKRDMGFLLAGARHFSTIEPVDREAIVRIRVAFASLLAFAGLWLPFAFSFGVFFAARGVLSPMQLEYLTLIPAVAGYLFGGVAYLIEERRVRRAKKVWHAKPWAEDLAFEEIRAWRRSVETFGDAIVPREAPALGPSQGRLFGTAGIVVAALAITVAVPVLTLLPASAVGPILTTVSAPAFEPYRPRAARTEAYRSYAAGGDLSVTPQEAGRILQVLTFVASADEPGPGEQAPEQRVEEPWIPDGEGGQNPFELDPFTWGDSLLERVGGGTTAEQRAYLARIASHPLGEDFSRLARATALDAASGRWETPFPPGLTMATLPVPQFGALRSAANARIAAAAYALAEDRPDDAERILSEVIAVGFLLADDGPTLIDNLVGYAIVEAAGAALTDLYRVSAQSGAAAELSRLRQVADRSAAMMPSGIPQGTDAWVRTLPEMVLDSALVRGLRWEYFINLVTMSPCLNVNRIVFGTDEDYDAFVEQARQTLVRWPSEEPLFELARAGWLGTADPGPPGILERVAGLYMSSGENSCTRMLTHVQSNSF